MDSKNIIFDKDSKINLIESIVQDAIQNALEEIDKKRKEIAFVEQSQIVAENCKNCKFYKICKGGCRRNKDFNAMNGEYENYFCKSYRIFFDICLERMIQIVEIIKNQKG